MSIIMQTEALSKRYSKQLSLDSLSMSITQGEIYGLVGPNGAGKTTLIKMLFGLATPSSGGFRLFGVKNTEQNISAARRRMNGIVETPAFYPHMSATQNLKAQAIMLGIQDKNKIPEVLSIVGLGDTGRKRVRNFSLGMKQRLGLAQALLTDAEFIVLDEPTNGLDPEGIIELRELIRRLNRERGITFLISSHYISELEQVITSMGILRKGKLHKSLTKDEMDRALTTALHIETENTSACIAALESCFSGARIMGPHTVAVDDTIDDVGRVWQLLSNSQVAVRDIHRVSTTLEDYVLACLNETMEVK